MTALTAVAVKILPVAAVLNGAAAVVTIATSHWEVWAPAANTLLLIVLSFITHGNRQQAEGVRQTAEEIRPEIETAGRIAKEVGAIIRETRPRSTVPVAPVVPVPQGPKGDTGPQGETGPAGPPGASR